MKGAYLQDVLLISAYFLLKDGRVKRSAGPRLPPNRRLSLASGMERRLQTAGERVSASEGKEREAPGRPEEGRAGQGLDFPWKHNKASAFFRESSDGPLPDTS